MQLSKQLNKIKSDAIDSQVYRACQYLQALQVAIEHKKTELGYPGKLAYDKECESNAAGMIETAMACLADEPPICVRQSICNVDTHEIVGSEEMEALIDQVGSELYKTFMGAGDA